MVGAELSFLRQRNARARVRVHRGLAAKPQRRAAAPDLFWPIGCVTGRAMPRLVKAPEDDAEKTNHGFDHTAPPIIIPFTHTPNRYCIGCRGRRSLGRLLAAVLDWLACESGGSEACDRKELAQLQLQIPVVGLAPSMAFAVAWIGGWRRVAVATFSLAVGTYLTWAVVADAAVHGWDDPQVLSSLI